MNKWVIAKEFDFCYGHRVHNQLLNQEYSVDNRCVCRHLHGHQGKIIVKLEADSLKSGMVTDFKHLNWFKKFLDETLDHKFIIDRLDPMFHVIVPHRELDYPITWHLCPEGHSVVDESTLSIITNPALAEILEGIVVVNFVPTSENLSKWLFDIVTAKMSNIGVKVSSVQFFETPKSQSSFIGE